MSAKGKELWGRKGEGSNQPTPHTIVHTVGNALRTAGKRIKQMHLSLALLLFKKQQQACCRSQRLVRT